MPTRSAIAASRFLRVASVALSLMLASAPVRAQQGQIGPDISGYPTYDYVTLGAPQFVNTNYLDPSIVTKITKFRSGYGHSYVDFVETCRSMKHYLFTTGITDTGLYAPVAGTIVTAADDSSRGTQIWIKSDAQPSFVFILFHLTPAAPLAVGDHVSEGQHLGGLYPTQVDPAAGGANSDIAVAVRVPGPEMYRQISYFEVLTDAALAPFRAKGVTAVSDLIITKAQRDAQPLSCYGETFLTPATDADFVTLTGATASLSVATTTLGMVYSSTQTSSQSFIRLYNANQSPQTVSLTLRDGSSGALLGQWTSPSISPGTAPQFPISTIEQALPAKLTKPPTYNVSAQSTGTTYVQHVLWRPTDGTLTNLSVCDGYVASLGNVVIGVHSSNLTGYPATVAVINTSNSAVAVPLGFYDGAGGGRTGGYTTPTIPPGAQYVVTMSELERLAHMTPFRMLYHYVVRSEARTNGIFLQALVSNATSNVVTDMTTLCQVSQVPTGATQTFDRGHGVRPGPIFSGAQPGSQSFLRFANTDASPSTYTVNLHNYASGTFVQSWTTPSIPAGAAQQFSISSIESALGLTANQPAYYAIDIQSSNSGMFQHVLWRASDGTLTDLSACEVGITSQPLQLNYVHSSVLDGGYPSSVVITNTGSTAAQAALQVYDSASGVLLGSFNSPSVPAGANVQLSAKDIEAQVPSAFDAGRYHYTIKAGFGFTGFLQHIVTSTRSGVVTDMTTSCNLPKIR